MTARRRIAVIATLCVALPVSSALATSTTKAGRSTKATVTVVAPASAVRSSRISVHVTSLFSVAGNGAERLTVFIAPPGVSCPKAVRRPRGADSLLSAEPADRVLIANLLSDRLSTKGTWTVCGYLTKGSKITAAARAHVHVG